MNKNASVFVGGVKASFTQEDIVEYFRGFGNILAIKMKKNKKKQSMNRGYCIVKFESPEAAEKVITIKNHVIKDRKVICRQYLKGENLRKSKVSKNQKKLYVWELPQETNNKDLEEVFKEYGALESAYTLMDEASGHSKGFGFISFEKEGRLEEVVKMIKEEGLSFEVLGQPIKARSYLEHRELAIEARRKEQEELGVEFASPRLSFIWNQSSGLSDKLNRDTLTDKESLYTEYLTLNSSKSQNQENSIDRSLNIIPVIPSTLEATIENQSNQKTVNIPKIRNQQKIDPKENGFKNGGKTDFFAPKKPENSSERNGGNQQIMIIPTKNHHPRKSSSQERLGDLKNYSIELVLRSSRSSDNSRSGLILNPKEGETEKNLNPGSQKGIDPKSQGKTWVQQSPKDLLKQIRPPKNSKHSKNSSISDGQEKSKLDSWTENITIQTQRVAKISEIYNHDQSSGGQGKKSAYKNIRLNRNLRHTGAIRASRRVKKRGSIRTRKAHEPIEEPNLKLFADLKHKGRLVQKGEVDKNNQQTVEKQEKKDRIEMFYDEKRASDEDYPSGKLGVEKERKYSKIDSRKESVSYQIEVRQKIKNYFYSRQGVQEARRSNRSRDGERMQPIEKEEFYNQKKNQITDQNQPFRKERLMNQVDADNLNQIKQKINPSLPNMEKVSKQDYFYFKPEKLYPDEIPQNGSDYGIFDDEEDIWKKDEDYYRSNNYHDNDQEEFDLDYQDGVSPRDPPDWKRVSFRERQYQPPLYTGNARTRNLKSGVNSSSQGRVREGQLLDPSFYPPFAEVVDVQDHFQFEEEKTWKERKRDAEGELYFKEDEFESNWAQDNEYPQAERDQNRRLIPSRQHYVNFDEPLYGPRRVPNLERKRWGRLVRRGCLRRKDPCAWIFRTRRRGQYDRRPRDQPYEYPLREEFYNEIELSENEYEKSSFDEKEEGGFYPRDIHQRRRGEPRAMRDHQRRLLGYMFEEEEEYREECIWDSNWIDEGQDSKLEEFFDSKQRGHQVKNRDYREKRQRVPGWAEFQRGEPRLRPRAHRPPQRYQRAWGRAYERELRRKAYEYDEEAYLRQIELDEERVLLEDKMDSQHNQRPTWQIYHDINIEARNRNRRKQTRFHKFNIFGLPARQRYRRRRLRNGAEGPYRRGDCDEEGHGDLNQAEQY